MSRNEAVADLLAEFADLLEARDVEHKPRAYRRAAENVREEPRAVEDLAAQGEEAVKDVDGVGDAIASKIVEYLETGEIEELEELRSELPVDMAAITAVEGVGPKTAGTLYEALGITTLDELAAAAENGEIREVEGFGPKTEQNIRESVAFARQVQGRERLGDALPRAETVLAYLRGLDAVERAAVAGSIRRWRATIGDVDVLAASANEDGSAVVEALTDWDGADEVIEAGESKASVRTEGIRVDLRVVAPAEFGAALQYFTGNKDHNVHLRDIAIDRGLKMNEYGVFEVEGVDDDHPRAGERIAGETEAEMYAALDLPVMPPELREDAGEIEAARAGGLPDLVTTEAIRGDLHVHTEWSDGGYTIREMIEAAADRDYDYCCITDHAAGAGVVGDTGLSEAELEDQMEAVEAAAAAVDADIEVFHGVEANVDADGELNTSDDLLAALDLVIASPHSALGQDAESATERLVRAIEHPHVDVIGHPTGRRLGERPGVEPAVERLVEAAVEHGTALEVNANPARLDLRDGAVRAAVEAGATVVVDTDAHSPAGLDNLRYGVHTARRGWAEPGDVLNARDAEGLRAFLSD